MNADVKRRLSAMLAAAIVQAASYASYLVFPDPVIGQVFLIPVIIPGIFFPSALFPSVDYSKAVFAIGVGINWFLLSALVSILMKWNKRYTRTTQIG